MNIILTVLNTPCMLLQYPYELALVGAVVWCMLVSCSRIYLGMHSVLVSSVVYPLLLCFVPSAVWQVISA